MAEQAQVSVGTLPDRDREAAPLPALLGADSADPAVAPEEKLRQVAERVGLEWLRQAVEDAEQLARPEEDSYFNLPPIPSCAARSRAAGRGKSMVSC